MSSHSSNHTRSACSLTSSEWSSIQRLGVSWGIEQYNLSPKELAEVCFRKGKDSNSEIKFMDMIKELVKNFPNEFSKRSEVIEISIEVDELNSETEVEAIARMSLDEEMQVTSLDNLVHSLLNDVDINNNKQNEDGQTFLPTIVTKVGRTPATGKTLPDIGTDNARNPKEVVDNADSTFTAVTHEMIPTKSNKALIAEATCNMMREAKDKKAINKAKLEYDYDQEKTDWSIAHKLLYRAIFAGHTKLVKALIHEGTSCSMIKAMNSNYLSNLNNDFSHFNSHYIVQMSPLHCAALAGHADIVKFFISKKVSNLQTTIPYSWSPLHCAVRNGHVSVVKVLIQAGADLDSKDDHKETPLHLALKHGHEEVASILIQAGADTNLMPGS